MGRDKVLDWLITQPTPGQSSVDFLLFTLVHLLPHMNAYDPAVPWSEQPERCVLILDNARVHDELALAVIEAAGVLVCRLPPYSPDFNPIEDVLKKQLAAPKRLPGAVQRLAIFKRGGDALPHHARHVHRLCTCRGQELLPEHMTPCQGKSGAVSTDEGGIQLHRSSVSHRLSKKRRRGGRTGPVPATTQPARAIGGSSTATIPKEKQRAEQLTLWYSLGIPHCVRLPIMCSSVFAFPSPVPFSDPTSALPRPEQVGVCGGGGAVELSSTQEHRSTLLSGARRAPGSGAVRVEEIVGSGVAGLSESVGRPGM